MWIAFLFTINWWDWMPWSSFFKSFKPTFSLSSFNFIKRLFNSSSLLNIRVVSSAYLRLFIFLPVILILACDLSNPGFHMMYTAFKLNKQGDNIQPWHTSFLIWNQPIIPCLALTVASWQAYRFLRRQIRCSGIPVSWRLSPSLLSSTWSKAVVCSIKEIYVFFWKSLAFSMTQQMLGFWSLVPLPFLNSAEHLEISIHILLKSCLENFEHSLALPFFGIGMKTELIQFCSHCWVFQICWCIECSTYTA